jgi:hypothetical protein
VCILPFRQDAYTKCIYPLKLHEHLAAEEWSIAIASALDSSSHESDRTARQAIARNHDWELIVQQIAIMIAESLGPEVRNGLGLQGVNGWLGKRYWRESLAGWRRSPERRFGKKSSDASRLRSPRRHSPRSCNLSG